MGGPCFGRYWRALESLFSGTLKTLPVARACARIRSAISRPARPAVGSRARPITAPDDHPLPAALPNLGGETRVSLSAQSSSRARLPRWEELPNR
jgi:hypothetical protein